MLRVAIICCQDKFAEHADDPSSPMEVFSNVSLYTFDVILRCSMSYDDNVQQQGFDYCLIACTLLFCDCNKLSIQ